VRPVLYAALLAGAATLAGCGPAEKPGQPAKSSPSAGSPVTVHAGNGAVTVPARPKRIVSLSPTATEMLYAVGAGPQVVAVDDQSDHPPGAPRTSLSGFKPNAEAVIGYRPDLVVLSTDTDGIVRTLQKVKIPVLLEPAAGKLADTYDQITDLGLATGHQARARTVAGDMRRQIDAAVRAVPKTARDGRRLTYYHELTNDLTSTTSKTFIGQVYTLFGLRNIADPADRQGSGYPKLAPEYLLAADPDLIFLADTKCCGQSAATVAARPGWRNLSAVTRRQVVALDDDVASRWGPRLVELVEHVGAAVRRAAGNGPAARQ
jgi:iron complex transport system substrate-binding protein